MNNLDVSTIWTMLQIAGAFATLAGTYAVCRVQITGLLKRMEKAEEEADALRLRVAEDCVKKGDLREVEERLSKRFDVLEHTVRNSMTSLMSAMMEGRPRRSTA